MNLLLYRNLFSSHSYFSSEACKIKRLGQFESLNFILIMNIKRTYNILHIEWFSIHTRLLTPKIDTFINQI